MPRSASSNMTSFWRVIALALLFFSWAGQTVECQEGLGPKRAQITEEIRTLETYPFSEPNPVPILTRDPRLYPYHSFEGYSTTSQPQDWKVVKLENDYIEVFVLPEVGGKVWGAVVKETGHEFIYRNEVLKFRNIALRGPWTSGGIEFNFGVIGHAPGTATPVDYTLKENDDGSVSCWVGGMDLPSRTHWRVEIRLPADRAYFETNVLWYNPTPLEQPYYNWMTAAAFARDDLEMTMPGNAYLQHSGEAESWPLDDEGRYLPLYGNNTFGSHKSFHVVGELNDFFGGYYHDDDYGFGHWARHEDMPGQKLWLWSLARDGGVWEDLLTDTDGQYVEFQAGRLFVQYSPGAHLNPITQAGFDPMSSSRWTETWFPLEGIGGLTDASKEGAMFVEEEDGELTVAVNAFRNVQDTLKVWSEGELVSEEPVTLSALQPFETTVSVTPAQSYRVTLSALNLDYRSSRFARKLQRPFNRDLGAVPPLSEIDEKIFQARELMKASLYSEAKVLFEEVQKREGWNREALLGLSELAIRNGEPVIGSVWADWARQLDAYDPKANFLAGTAYRAMAMPTDAMDAFGWAARSVAYRSAAYVQLSGLKMEARDFPEARRYAQLAIDFDRYSVPGWQAMAVVGRKTRDNELVEQALNELETLDPLHHFVWAERMLAQPGDQDIPSAASGGEYPDQTLLELAIGYHRMGLTDDALRVLKDTPRPGPAPLMHTAWIARLTNDPSLLENPDPPAFEFPHRGESFHALGWAVRENDHWVWKYLLALLHQATDQKMQALFLFDELSDTPDFAPYYVARAHLLNSVRGDDPESDLLRARELDPGNQIYHIQVIRHYQDRDEWGASLEALAEARDQFPSDFNLDLLQAKALINVGRGAEAAAILGSTHVLPSEHARASHQLWEQAHLVASMNAHDKGSFQEAREHLMLALEWPEHLGQGRPYQPDERLINYVLARVENALGDREASREADEAFLRATGELKPPRHGLDVLTLRSLRSLGRAEEAQAISSRYDSELQALSQVLSATTEGRLIQRALELGIEGG